MKVRSETVEMAAVALTFRGRDPGRACDASQGPRSEDALQGGQIRDRSRSFVNGSG